MSLNRRNESGFSLIELLVAVAIFMIVSGTALEGVFRLTKTSRTVSNRSEMHAAVRNATELLQQEVGQAGRVALPTRVQFTVGAAAGSQTVTLKAVNAAGGTLSGAGGDFLKAALAAALAGQKARLRDGARK